DDRDLVHRAELAARREAPQAQPAAAIAPRDPSARIVERHRHVLRPDPSRHLDRRAARHAAAIEEREVERLVRHIAVHERAPISAERVTRAAPLAPTSTWASETLPWRSSAATMSPRLDHAASIRPLNGARPRSKVRLGPETPSAPTRASSTLTPESTSSVALRAKRTKSPCLGSRGSAGTTVGCS